MGRKRLVRKAEPSSKRGTRWPRWTGLGDKTVWDLLQLLIVPLMLAALGFWFSAQQDARQQRFEDQRAEAERKLAEQRAQDEALQAYLDQMSSLLLERDLRESEEDSEVRTLARARTLTVLERLDPARKIAILRFLYEADLITTRRTADGLIDLSGAYIDDIYLADERWSSVDLSGASIADAYVVDADLSEADLSGADLTDTDFEEADLSGADLSSANLENTDLRVANLSGADLRKAYLPDTLFHGADLSNADLTDSCNITKDALERQAESLQGAKMPDETFEQGIKESKNIEHKKSAFKAMKAAEAHMKAQQYCTRWAEETQRSIDLIEE